MKILAVSSEKGGAGKTTVSVHLAVAAQLAGLDAAIIDLDPQASSADWCGRRAGAPEGVAIPPSRPENLLTDLRGNEIDLVVLDCGRDSHNAGYLAAMASDLALIHHADRRLRLSGVESDPRYVPPRRQAALPAAEWLAPGRDPRREGRSRGLGGRRPGHRPDGHAHPRGLRDRQHHRPHRQETEPGSAAAGEITALFK